MSKGQRIKPQCKMKTQFSKEKMLLKWSLLLGQPLSEGPLLETNDSIPLFREQKKGLGGSFQKNVIGLLKCPHLKGRWLRR